MPPPETMFGIKKDVRGLAVCPAKAAFPPPMREDREKGEAMPPPETMFGIKKDVRGLAVCPAKEDNTPPIPVAPAPDISPPRPSMAIGTKAPTPAPANGPIR